MKDDVTRIWAIIGFDHQSGTWCIPVFGTDRHPGTLFPLLATTEKRLREIRELAQVMADATGDELTVAEFSTRKNLEKVIPVKKEGN